MKNKIIAGTILSVSCIGLFFAGFNANANVYGFKWAHKSGNFALVKASTSNLNSTYNGSAFTNGIAKWNGASGAHIAIQSSSVANANVDLHSVTKAQWNSNGWGATTYAVTVPYNNGVACASGAPFSDPNDLCPTRTDYAALYFNESYEYSDQVKKEALVAHEIGHAVGLSHTTYIGVQSIMAQGLSKGTNVTAYDIGELNSLYP
ncbi:matrixin family metalloprotease [Paenibacillus chitinolyticus]|uniref:matrixin family metalloprotease n=1 Tax=Paenibacillus chitinolyticus TaxID=79263 RepID=UPI00366EE200